MKRQKRPIRIGKSLIFSALGIVLVALIAGALLVREYVLPFSGPLEVEVSNQSTTANPVVVANLKIKLNGEQLSVPNLGTTSVPLAREWASSERIDLRIESTFTLERDTTLIVNPKLDLGFTGSDSGKKLILYVVIKDDSIASILVEDSSAGAVLAKSTFQRENFLQALDLCVGDQINTYRASYDRAEDAYSDYLEAVENADLDGELWLYYTTWASRSAKLIPQIDGIKGMLDVAATPSTGPIHNVHLGVSRALGDVRSAWSNFYRVSLLEAESQWDDAWNQIRAAESELQSRSQSVSSVAGELRNGCRATLVDG
jgi:hypothetical protein